MRSTVVHARLCNALPFHFRLENALEVSPWWSFFFKDIQTQNSNLKTIMQYLISPVMYGTDHLCRILISTICDTLGLTGIISVCEILFHLNIY